MIAPVAFCDRFRAPAREAIDIVGLPELPIRDVSFENVKIVAEKGVLAADCKNVRFKDTKLTSPSGEAFPSQTCKHIALAPPGQDFDK